MFTVIGSTFLFTFYAHLCRFKTRVGVSIGKMVFNAVYLGNEPMWEKVFVP